MCLQAGKPVNGCRSCEHLVPFGGNVPVESHCTRSIAGSGRSPRYSTQAFFTHG